MKPLSKFKSNLKVNKLIEMSKKDIEKIIDILYLLNNLENIKLNIF
jgi:hypothetical protein